jgi:hypothetical protein
MPAKKSAPKKTASKAEATAGKKSGSGGKGGRTLQELVKSLKDPAESAFREKLRDLVCRANKGDAKAAAELARIVQPSAAELRKLCLSRARVQVCTDQTLLCAGLLAGTE